MSGFLLHRHGNPAHIAAHGHNDHNKNRDQNAHNQCQLPADGSHHNQGADDGYGRGQQILRAVVGKLRQLKQVGGQPAHQLAGTVRVIKIIAELLHMPEQIRPDVRLYPDAEGMAEIADNVVEYGPQNIKGHGRGHQGKKHLILSVGQQIIQGFPGHQREGQIDEGDQHRAGDVHGKQTFMISEVMKEYPQGALLPVFFRCHSLSPLKSNSSYQYSIFRRNMQRGK